MAGEKWRKIASEGDIQEGKQYVNEEVDDSLFLIRINGEIKAYSSLCPHHAGPLEKGMIEDGELVCPFHNARFDIETGQLLDPPALDDLPTYKVKIENGDVFIGEKAEHPVSMPGGTDHRRVLIIGAGASANACAEMLRRADFSGQIIMFTKEEDLPYDRVRLSKGFISGAGSESKMPLRSEDYYERLGIEIRRNTEVIELKAAEKTIVLNDGCEEKGDRILIATGGRPKKLPLDGMNLHNVFILRSMEDGRRIKAAAGSASRIVLVGASFIGMELASDLRSMEKEVTVVAPETAPGALVFGERIGKWFQRLGENNGVRFKMGVKPTEFSGELAVEKVELSDGSSESADLVILGVGVVPCLDFLKSSGLVENEVVPVDNSFRTKADSIYASGDVAYLPYPSLGDRFRIEHWTEAERQGRAAALSMIGEASEYNSVPFFWTMQHGTPLKFVGFPTNFDKIVYVGDVESDEFAAGFYAGDRLTGAASVMCPDVLARAEKAIESGVGISFDDLDK